MKSKNQVNDELAEIASEELIGRRAHLALRPEWIGQITAVIIRAGGRAYELSVPLEDGILEAILDGFQLELDE